MPTPLTYPNIVPIKGGDGNLIAVGTQLYTDPARSNAQGPVVAIRTADGQDLGMGQATKANSLPVTVASDQNIALETGGNLATIATAQGVQGTGLTPPTGGSGVLGFLSGMFNKLNTAISVTVGNFPATQAISAAALPLPTGAAQESGGNLATIATAQGTGGTGITQPTGGSGLLGWLSGIFNKLNTSVAVTGTFWQTTQPVSLATLPALTAGSAVAGKFGIDQTTPGVTNAIAQPDPAKTTGSITVVDAGSTTVTNSIGQSVVTGTATAGSFVSAAVSGYATARVQLVSTNFTGTVVFERSFDGGTVWFGLNALASSASTGATFSTVAFAGTASTQVFEINISGATNLRVRDTAAVTNSLAVTIQPGYGTSVITSANLATRTNAYRNSGILHRSAITAADKLTAGGTITISAITESGSTLAAVATYATICPYNRWGNGQPSSVVNITPTANQAVRLAFSQVTGADGYDIFCGTTAGAPLWVGRITEAQRAAGGYIISTIGSVTTNAGTPAGAIDVGIIGSATLASNIAPFTFNNSYTPGTPTAINCAGYSLAHVLVKLTLTDLRSAPTLSLMPFVSNQTSGTDFHQLLQTPVTLNLLTANGASLEQDIVLNIDGSTGLVILVDGISGQGASINIWVELA